MSKEEKLKRRRNKTKKEKLNIISNNKQQNSFTNGSLHEPKKYV